MATTIDVAVHAPGAIRFRRNTAAIALTLSGVGLFVGSIQLPAITQEVTARFSGEGGAAAMATFARDANSHNLLTAVTLTALLLAIPGVLGLMRLLRGHSPRLALAAGVSLLVSFVMHFGVSFLVFDSVSWAQYAPAAAGAYLDSIGWPAITMVIFFVAVGGVFLGSLLVGISAITSPRCPTWAGVALLGYPVGFFANFLTGNPWLEVAGTALQLLAFARLSVSIAQVPLTEWRACG